MSDAQMAGKWVERSAGWTVQRWAGESDAMRAAKMAWLTVVSWDGSKAATRGARWVGYSVWRLAGVWGGLMAVRWDMLMAAGLDGRTAGT